MALLSKDFLLVLMELYLLSATAQITTILKFILAPVEYGVDRDKIANIYLMLGISLIMVLWKLCFPLHKMES